MSLIYRALKNIYPQQEDSEQTVLLKSEVEKERSNKFVFSLFQALVLLVVLSTIAMGIFWGIKNALKDGPPFVVGTVQTVATVKPATRIDIPHEPDEPVIAPERAQQTLFGAVNDSGDGQVKFIPPPSDKSGPQVAPPIVPGRVAPGQFTKPQTVINSGSPAATPAGTILVAPVIEPAGPKIVAPATVSKSLLIKRSTEDRQVSFRPPVTETTKQNETYEAVVAKLKQTKLNRERQRQERALKRWQQNIRKQVRTQSVVDQLSNAVVSGEENVINENLKKLETITGKENTYIVLMNAYRLMQQEDFQAAKPLLENVLRRHPYHLQAGINMAIVEWNMGEENSARMRLKTLNNEYPRSKEVVTLRRELDR